MSFDRIVSGKMAANNDNRLWLGRDTQHAFVRREMTITLDDVACLQHLPISGKLLDHSKIKRDEP